MSGAPQHNILPIDLSSAGSDVIQQFTGVLRLIEVLDASGSVDLTGKVNVTVGEVDRVEIPLRYGQAIFMRSAAVAVTISWEAQAGLTAKFFMSADPNDFDMDADPPSQLVIGDLASAFAYDTVTIGTSAAVIVAANTSRRSVTVRNEGSATIYLGGSGVATSDGLPLDAGQAFTFEGTTAAIYGISGSAGQDVRYLEEG